MVTNREFLPSAKPIGSRNAAAMAGILLLVLSSILLVVLYNFQANRQFAAVLALMLGFTAVSAVRLLQSRPNAEPRRITFNEHALLAQLSVVVNTELSTPQTEPNVLPWDMQAHDLVGRDNALALAKVRLDLERELRRLIDESNLAQPRTQSVRQYAEILLTGGVIPHEMLPSLIEVSRVANAALQGIDLTTDVVAGAVKVGEELVDILRSLPKQAA